MKAQRERSGMAGRFQAARRPLVKGRLEVPPPAQADAIARAAAVLIILSIKTPNAPAGRHPRIVIGSTRSCVPPAIARAGAAAAFYILSIKTPNAHAGRAARADVAGPVRSSSSGGLS